MTELATAPSPPRDPERWLVPSQASTWEIAQVAAVDRQTSATALRLRLSAVPEQLLPGQYYLVRLATPIPPFSVQQAYSLSSSPYPASAHVEMVVRAVAGGRASPLLAHQVEAGDLLQVHGPYGSLTWTERDGGPLVLIGGGSGVVPLVSIVRYAAARGLDVPMTLLCSSRDRASVLLREALEELGDRHRWLSIVHTLTRSSWDPFARYHRRVDVPMLAEVLEQAGADLANTSFYVAGPGDMVLSVREGLGELGVAQSSIFDEDHG